MPEGSSTPQEKNPGSGGQRSILKRFKRNDLFPPPVTPQAKAILVEKVGIENIWNAIETGTEIFLDVRKAWEDDEKITFLEGVNILITNASGAVRVFTHLKELGLEFMDLDQTERADLTSRFAKKFRVDNQTAELKIELVFDFGLWLVAGVTDFVAAWTEIEDLLSPVQG